MGINDTFEGVVYHSLVQRVTVAARMASVTKAFGKGGGENGSSEQLAFSFFAETRTEELLIFNRRTQAVGKKAKGAQSETFAQISQKVSARFEFSLTMSGRALNGFAGAGESLAGSGQLEQLNDFVARLLDEADEILEEVFALLDGFLKGLGDLGEQIEDLLSTFDGFRSSAQGAQACAQSMTTHVQLEFEFTFSAEVTIAGAEVEEADPIVLDLDGDGIELTHFADGARFDLLGTGRQVNTAFVTGGDAFLVLDRNGNGIIDDGGELFGTQRGASNGFEELRALDSNHDGLIDRRDALFDQLQVFRDNGDGRTDPGELLSLSAVGIRALSLAYKNTDIETSGGNRIAQIGSFIREDGTQGRAADALLKFTA